MVKRLAPTLHLRGLDFVLTSMFTAILTDRWLREKSHLSAWIGMGVSVLCLAVFRSVIADGGACSVLYSREKVEYFQLFRGKKIL